MAKRWKNFRDDRFDDWEDIRKEDRRNEKRKNKRRQKRHTRLDEKFRNFKDFREDYDD